MPVRDKPPSMGMVASQRHAHPDRLSAIAFTVPRIDGRIAMSLTTMQAARFLRSNSCVSRSAAARAGPPWPQGAALPDAIGPPLSAAANQALVRSIDFSAASGSRPTWTVRVPVVLLVERVRTVPDGLSNA